MSRRKNIDYTTKQYADKLKNEIIEEMENNKEEQKNNIKDIKTDLMDYQKSTNKLIENLA